jgi:pSer/pThr/pTyr-binding forkhead associated (FHA) protein
MSRESSLERFRKACGLVAPLALAAQETDAPPPSSQPLEWPGPFLLIGRHPRDDLSLPGRQVSRRHAYLQAVAGRVLCIDLKSRGSTFWDDETEARPWGWLDPGQSLRIGPYRIYRTDRQPEEPASLLDPFSPPDDQVSVPHPLPRPMLELPFRVGGLVPTWEMAGLLALAGRTEDCQFLLNDDSISRTHASLVRTPLGTWVVDLGSREGVHVNGTRVRWAWLADGDLVRFGLFTMVLRYDRPPEGIDREDIPLVAGAIPAESVDDRRRGDLAPTEEDGRALAVRPTAGAPGFRKASAPPQTFSSAAPAAVERGEWEPAFGPGPTAYAMWQQQMQLMETFHNDMAMMVQMFIAMHREFQGSVRAELKRIQHLTRELGRLNARLGQLPDPSGAGPARETVRPEREARAVPGAVPSGPEAKPHPRKAQRADAATGREPGSRDADPVRAGRSAPVSEDPGKAGSGPSPVRESAEMYADLTRRITELQRERRGYWQRTLKIING